VVVLVATLAKLGLDSIVVRELVGSPEERPTILGSAFAVRLLAAIGVFALVSGVALQLGTVDRELLLILPVAGGLVFNTADVIALDFQARVQSRYVVQSEMGQMVVSAVVKLALVALEAPLVWFAVAILVESAIRAGFLIIAYKSARDCGTIPLQHWRFSWNTGRRLLGSSWPLVFSGLALSVYMRIDQVMLRVMLDTVALGHYSAAVRIAESWLFLATALTTSLFPAILNAKKAGAGTYLKRLQDFYALMLWISVPIAGALWLLAEPIVYYLLGEAFIPASPVLATYAWAGVFVFQITASSRWYLTEGHEDAILFRAVSGAVLNIVLNYLLIPVQGIRGAALATLLSYGFMALGYDLVDRRGHMSFKLKVRSLVAPLSVWRES
jgi:O-antigen/teichoic acid export membrane protein